MTLLDIYKEMLDMGERIKEQSLTPSELTRILRGFVGTDDIKLATRRDPKVDPNQVVVCGIYDPHEDEAGLPSISLYVTFNPDQRKLNIAELDWPRLCLDIIECSGHEIIHQEQYRARDFDIGPHIFASGKKDPNAKQEQEYLGNPDEIDAYGYSIAVEVYLRFAPKRISSKFVQQTSMFKTYKNAFGVQHPVVLSLLSYVVKYFTQLNTGGANV